jgi:prolyl oligopeptidase
VNRSLDRREFIGRGAALVAAPLLPAVLRAASQAAVPVPPAPVAPVEVVHDTYFGETLSDPYRWMENPKDPRWLPYLSAENRHARTILDALPGRAALLKRITALSGDNASTVTVQRAGGLTFFEQRPVGANNNKLFVRSAAGVDRVLLDPTRDDTAGGHVSLDWWHASPHGRYVVYGLSKNGSEDSMLHLLRVSDGKDLPERIANTEAANPSWLEDESGFFYNLLTAAVGTPERYLDSEARWHRLGTDPAHDPVLMKRGLVAGIDYDRIQSPSITATIGSRYALLQLADIRPEFRAYVAPVQDVVRGTAKWTPICAFEDEVTDLSLDGEDLYLLVNHGTARGRLVKTAAAAPQLRTAAPVVPQGKDVIEHLALAQDGLYLSIMDGGTGRLRRVARDGTLNEVTLPFEGALDGVFARPDEPGVVMSLVGWLNPSAIYRVSAAGAVTDIGITPGVNIDVSLYETQRLFATAKDGVKIPYTLVKRKDLKPDGTTPVWMSGYGSYGFSYTPRFAPRTLALLDAGVIIGYANVRGGGEYGREWHRAGQLQNKPNTWRDLIAVCEDVIARKYTSAAHLAIGGRSAGGITVGRALTERPELFAAVIDGVGWSNPLRYVAEQDGYAEEPEWGAIAERAGYQSLKLIDSYQAVRDGTPYPAVLLTTGITDPRVAPFHVGKMTARLQAASSSGKPILLRVDFDAGHGIGSTRAQGDREAADTYAFLLWQLRRSGAQSTKSL